MRCRGLLCGLHCPSRRSSQSAPSGHRSSDKAPLRNLSQLRHFTESFSLCADQFKREIQDRERGRFGPSWDCGCRGRWRGRAVAELESRFRARGIWIRPLFRGGVRKPCHRRLHDGGRLPMLASSGSKILSKKCRVRRLPFRVCHQPDILDANGCRRDGVQLFPSTGDYQHRRDFQLVLRSSPGCFHLR